MHEIIKHTHHLQTKARDPMTNKLDYIRYDRRTLCGSFYDAVSTSDSTSMNVEEINDDDDDNNKNNNNNNNNGSTHGILWLLFE